MFSEDRLELESSSYTSCKMAVVFFSIQSRMVFDINEKAIKHENYILFWGWGMAWQAAQPPALPETINTNCTTLVG